MTTAAERASAYNPDPISVLQAEWRRTGMPGELRAGPDQTISACTKDGARIRLTSPFSVAAVLQHLPAAKEADELFVRVVQRLLVERACEAHEYSESAAALDVLRPRVMSVLRKGFLAVRVMASAFQERRELDAYVVALEARMRGSELSDAWNEAAARRAASEDHKQYLTPDVGEHIALLCDAERIRAGAPAGTVEFWDLVCEELAGSVRTALADLANGGEGAVVQKPGGCPSCGADKELASAGSCLECAMSGLLQQHSVEALPGRPEDKEHSELFEFGRSAAALAHAAASLNENARPAREHNALLVPSQHLRALRMALADFEQATGAAMRNLHGVELEQAPGGEVPCG